jgi:hypothetical protein
MRRVVISYKLEVLVNGFKLMIQDTDFFSNGVLKTTNHVKREIILID